MKSMNKYILVIGVLGIEYNPLIYRIEEEKISSTIPSLAFYKYIISREENVNLLLLVPESLIPANLIKDKENVNIAKLLKDRDLLLDNIYPHIDISKEKIDKNNFRIIGSLGKYNLEKKKLIFKNKYDNVVLDIFFHILNKVIENSGMNIVIYADISIGHNLYISALIEALKAIIVYHKLRNIIFRRGEEIVVKSIISEPIIPIGSEEAMISYYDIDVKAFFTLPFTATPKADHILESEKRREVMRKYHKESYYKEYNEIVNDIWRKLKPSFNAIIYNTPLVFYHHDIINFDTRDLNISVDFFEKISNFMNFVSDKEIKIYSKNDSIIVVEKLSFKSRYLINLFYSAALLESIANFWAENIKGKEPKASHIEKTFT